jgi:hypothetical protein
MSVTCATLGANNFCQNNHPQPTRFVGVVMPGCNNETMAVIVNHVEQVTLAEIDEALGYLVDTLRQQPDRDVFMCIVDELLDARLELTP